MVFIHFAEVGWPTGFRFPIPGRTSGYFHHSAACPSLVLHVHAARKVTRYLVNRVRKFVGYLSVRFSASHYCPFPGSQMPALCTGQL